MLPTLLVTAVSLAVAGSDLRPPFEPAPHAATTPPDLLGDVFGGVAFGDSADEVTAKLEGLYDKLERHAVTRLDLPLARESQTHLIAQGVAMAGVDEVAFTFGDDALVLVEARGGAVNGLLFAFEEREPYRVGGYRAWPDASVVANDEQDAVWLLGPGALHANLFLWSNPHLPSAAGSDAPRPRSAAAPQWLRFGASIEELLPHIEKDSAFHTREEIASPWLPTEPEQQVQINAFGVPYAGFPRKVEAVFGDDRLQLAWILTGEQEEARLRAELVRAFGPPIFVSSQWESFDDWRVSLRKDKPEVLMIADELIPMYRPQIEATAD